LRAELLDDARPPAGSGADAGPAGGTGVTNAEFYEAAAVPQCRVGESNDAALCIHAHWPPSRVPDTRRLPNSKESPMRRRLTVPLLATLGILGGLAAAAAPAAAVETPCVPAPQVSGFTITSLSESGIGCHHAGELATHLIRHGTAPVDWTCTLTIIGRNVSRRCVNLHFSDRTLSLSYFVH
jgi:hypothetical protein